METMREFWRRVVGLIGRRRREREMQEEMQHHIDMEVERNLRAGMSKQDATAIARRRFGSVSKIKLKTRDDWMIPWIEQPMRDLYISARSLRKSTGFTLTVVFTLALCIGANAAVLSALYSLVLKPLPVNEPDRLVQLFNVMGSGENQQTSNSSWNQYSELKQRSDLFEGVAIRNPITRILNDGPFVRRVRGQQVTPEFFDLMGARPVLGRFFAPDEGGLGSDHIVVLTQTDWEDVYDSDADVLGRQILFDNGVAHTIIGVAPQALERFDFDARFYIPFEVSVRDRIPDTGRYSARSNDLWLRLQEGVSRENAIQQIREIESRWYQDVANADARNSFRNYTRFDFDLPHPLEGSLYLLESGSLLILLVGCFNIMTLLLGRLNHKRHELTIRTILGSGKNALRRLMVIETGLLITASVLVGVAVAMGGTHAVNQYLAVLSPGSMPVELDWAVLAGTLTIIAGMLIVMGLLPLEVLWRAGMLDQPVRGGRSSTAGERSRQLSQSMVIGQVALAFALLIGAGLLLRSFQRVTAVDAGFDAAHVVQGRIDFMSTYPFYPTRNDAAGLKQRIYTAMKEIPEVESVSLSMFNMFAADDRKEGRGFLIRGQLLDPSLVRTSHVVTQDFFTTMGISIIDGRNFDSSDDENSIIVDELFARRYFGNRSPVGAEIHWTTTPPAPGESWRHIIGVSGRANVLGLEERDGVPLEYVYDPVNNGSWEYTILLRTARPAESVIEDMRARLHNIDPRIPLSYAGVVEESFDEMLLGRKGITLLLASFAGLALSLSVIGVYSVQAYDVSQRKKEVAIRVAVGATRGNILKMIVWQGMQKAGLGLILGIVGAVVLSRYLTGLLFDVTPLDVRTYLGALLLLVIAALAASFLPAIRAMEMDPRQCLAE